MKEARLTGHPWLTAIFRRVIAWRWAIVAIYAAAMIPCAGWAMKVGHDSSLDRILVPTDPGFLETKAFEEVFGGGEYAVLIVEADEPLSLPVLTKVDALERAIAAIPGIEVSSLVSAFREAKAGFEPKPEDAARLAKYATGTKLFEQQGLVGKDFLTIGLVLTVEGRDDRSAKVAAIESAIASVGEGQPLRAVRRVGTPYVNTYFDDATKRSGPLHFGLFAVFVVVLTVALYRSFRTLLTFLLTLGVCLCVSLGYIGATGGMFTIVSPMVPMTILVTATATLVYLQSRFVEHPADVPLEQHRIDALCNKFLACTASVFAATVGFAALVVSDIRPIREMGIWVAVGLFGSWVVTFTLFPALQRILKTPTHLERKGAAPWFEKLSGQIPLFTYRWRWPLVLSSLVLSVAGVIAIFGAGPYLEPMAPLTEPIEYVNRSHPLYQDTVRAREVLPGLSVTNVWIKGKDVLVSDPPVLAGLHRYEQALATDPEVGAAIGLPTFLRLVRYSGEGTDAWPADKDELEEMAANLEGLALVAPQTLRRFADRSMAQTQIVVLSHAAEHTRFERLQERIRFHWEESKKAEPALAKLEISTVGLGPLQAKMSQNLVPTLVESFALTAGIIFITFLIVFRSGAARIMTMLPSLFAILVMFLVMRIFGMSLNIATILIASTVLGTSENDQIHFFYHFLEGRKTQSVSGALRHTFLIAGRAIFFATIINAGGFLAFATAEMRPMQQFGTLTALSLILSMLADFTALPAALWILFREKPPSEA